MNQLQIKALIIDIENKTDKNGHSYYRLSLQGFPARYFYAFSFSLPSPTWQTLVDFPHRLVNQQVLITYQELPNKDNSGTFFKVQALELT